jgi:tRNA (guanine37-N1)-methyltransferase
MWFGLISLFPEMFDAVAGYGVSRRAIERKQVELQRCNPRDFTQDKHRTVDDRPYGGGPGMVMMNAPLEAALKASQEQAQRAVGQKVKTLYLSPQGVPLTQSLVKALAQEPGLILMSGRYEGVDERFIESHVDLELSIGDYVLSGGELAAMVVMDSVIRLLPGVLGHKDSAEQDSHSDGLLDCPHYTRPEIYADKPVPEVLLSGNHQRIEQWRLKQSLGRTWLRRPDLLSKRSLTVEEQQLLDEFKTEFRASSDSGE